MALLSKKERHVGGGDESALQRASFRWGALKGNETLCVKKSPSLATLTRALATSSARHLTSAIVHRETAVVGYFCILIS